MAPLIHASGKEGGGGSKVQWEERRGGDELEREGRR